jgi:hypothetical protein
VTEGPAFLATDARWPLFMVLRHEKRDSIT